MEAIRSFTLLTILRIGWDVFNTGFHFFVIDGLTVACGRCSIVKLFIRLFEHFRITEMMFASVRRTSSTSCFQMTIVGNYLSLVHFEGFGSICSKSILIKIN